jgi:predicted transcriptional regulator
LPAGEIPKLIADVYAAIERAGTQPERSTVYPQKAAVNPKRSIHNDYIICLEDGKKFKSLRRHLMTHYGLKPQRYREKWSLDASYPMVAPSYSLARSELAKKLGLGRNRRGSRLGM